MYVDIALCTGRFEGQSTETSYVVRMDALDSIKVSMLSLSSSDHKMGVVRWSNES
jgi:hypothetical protein